MYIEVTHLQQVSMIMASLLCLALTIMMVVSIVIVAQREDKETSALGEVNEKLEANKQER